VRRLLADAGARSRWAANRRLAALEDRLSPPPPATLPTPPIVILGAPRTGSTLLHQLMAGCLDVGYLSNLHCRFWGSPALVERALRGRPRPSVAFESRHGNTQGRRAPSECGQFWYRFFRRSPQHVSLADADPARMRALRRSVAAFEAAAHRPLVFKNLVCSLRVAPIAAALPEALFVVIHRDLLDSGHSLLVARRRVLGGYDRWWSAEPPGFQQLLGLPPEQQVVGQVRAVEAAIDAAREGAGRDRFLDVRYEDLCADPDAVLTAVIGFAAGHGATLVQTARPPASFPRGDRRLIDRDLYRRLELAAAARA
jgi:LPS sulfotransferase NodH